MARKHDNSHRNGKYRLVDPAEIKDPLRDLHNIVVLLAENVAIDFAANGVRLYGRLTNQFTPYERLLALHLCFQLLHSPEVWVRMEKLVNEIHPLPEAENTFCSTDPRHSIQQIVSQLRGKLGYVVSLRCARNLGYKLEAKRGYGYAIVRVK
jgi:hypothetical protein